LINHRSSILPSSLQFADCSGTKPGGLYGYGSLAAAWSGAFPDCMRRPIDSGKRGVPQWKTPGRVLTGAPGNLWGKKPVQLCFQGFSSMHLAGFGKWAGGWDRNCGQPGRKIRSRIQHCLSKAKDEPTNNPLLKGLTAACRRAGKEEIWTPMA